MGDIGSLIRILPVTGTLNPLPLHGRYPLAAISPLMSMALKSTPVVWEMFAETCWFLNRNIPLIHSRCMGDISFRRYPAWTFCVFNPLPLCGRCRFEQLRRTSIISLKSTPVVREISKAIPLCFERYKPSIHSRCAGDIQSGTIRGQQGKPFNPLPLHGRYHYKRIEIQQNKHP